MVRPAGAHRSKSGRPPSEFGEWLLSELDARGWSRHRLAKEMDRSSGMVANMIYYHSPSEDTCRLVAQALGIDERTVLDKALWRQSADDRMRREVYDKIDNLDAEQLTDLLAWLRERS
jgi:transcriptional regulator with XRE-family HTH domain